MRQPLPITATSETRQEALKIQQERSQLAAHLGFIDRKMLRDRWSLEHEVAWERRCSGFYFLINFYFQY